MKRETRPMDTATRKAVEKATHRRVGDAVRQRKIGEAPLLSFDELPLISTVDTVLMQLREDAAWLVPPPSRRIAKVRTWKVAAIGERLAAFFRVLDLECSAGRLPDAWEKRR